ncbi:MAG: signal peptidase II [Fimbriiglobus sp.]
MTPVTRTYRRMALIVALLALVSDLGSKYGMFRGLYQEGKIRSEMEVVPGWFKFTTEYNDSVPWCDCGFDFLQKANAPVMPRVNYGALFGLGGEHKSLANWIFAGISFTAAVGISIWLTRPNSGKDRWLSLALGLILGGTVGNLYDRLVFHGVRDFLYFYKIEWPVFNIADCCLVVGAGILLLHAFLVPTPATATPTAPAQV